MIPAHEYVHDLFLVYAVHAHWNDADARGDVLINADGHWTDNFPTTITYTHCIIRTNFTAYQELS